MVWRQRHLAVNLTSPSGGDKVKLSYKISTFLILALGIIHVSMTPVFFKRFAPDAMWFASGGLMMILISFMNFVMLKDVSKERVVRPLCHSTNIIGLIFASTMFVLGWSRTTPPLQSFFVLFLFVFETVAAFVIGSRRSVRVA